MLLLFLPFAWDEHHIEITFEVDVDNTPEVKSSATDATAGYRIPGYLLAIYATLLISLGWLSHQRWTEMENPTLIVPTTAIATSILPHTVQAQNTTSRLVGNLTAAQTQSKKNRLPVKHTINNSALNTVEPGELPPLIYSAHVYTSGQKQRSITLNRQLYHEGDSPIKGLIIERIEQEVTVFSFNGEPFILDALEDWPGGKPAAPPAE
ncbi:type II secretion system assembly factor GspB [Prodigiosinella aquatilis]|nr:type II secretion system assembly factor GspB [Prodigiosinella sp. LS101]WJV52602.1 type II secretion system assembly factor GspB [Prodigiosinella sp. LS101]WJV56956.1 type II secretion system assembly factor GspB [Pectobacteriaceae bacterium C111]